DLRRSELEDRERQLLQQHKEAWLGPLADVRARGFECRFKRGLIHVSARARNFFGTKRLAALAATETGAWLGSLELMSLDPQWLPTVADTPLLAHLPSLHLPGIGAKGAGALAASPHLARLTSLDLEYSGLGDAGAAALAASPHLASLTTLSLQGSGI